MDLIGLPRELQDLVLGFISCLQGRASGWTVTQQSPLLEYRLVSQK